ncbi:MAG: site-specific integrase [Phycisphaeraceae bacterium]|nr:site-specific integrase [Phycisphaerae bacterium]MBX3391641.1 site-specific integrase [Phycisphaeraceae bacterium]
MARKQRGRGTGSLFRKTGKGPWIASYFDHSGKRREHSTRTTDRQAAERILTKLVADTALRRDLVIDPRDDRFATEGRRALTEHVAGYIAHCHHAGQAPHHVAQKETQLDAMIAGSKASRLVDLTADALELHLSALKARKLSARSVNFARQIAVAFYGWLVKTGKAESNPLRVVPKQDEARDRRRVRRPLTDDELGRLLAVARERGRDAWYLAAALAGLRKGDMMRLTWADVDFEAATLTLRHGKARRVDVIPMHPQLAEALKARLRAFPAVPTARVWSDTVGDVTRLKDFLRAGIARRVPVLDREGNPVMIGEGKKAEPKTRISVEDDEGRVIDLHALRTTLGTQLARAGVTPQIAQRLMRHSDYRTTLKHYTVLGLTDTAGAIAKLPGIRPTDSESLAATGTTDSAPVDPQLFCQQLGRETGKNSAAQRGGSTIGTIRPANEKPLHSQGFSRDSSKDSSKRATGIEPATFSLGS